ncbi:cytochrome-c oxidase [Pseudomonas sp. ODNR1LW]|nr:cytochrome-c oxidase [Pseudomonas sp. ODNR1LW]
MNLSTAFLRLAVLFAALGVSLGYFMGVTHDFALSPVHAHINLLGWVSMFLYGLFYRAFPEAQSAPLPLIHFWLAVLGMPIMMAALAVQLLGVASLMPFAAIGIIAGPTLVLLGMFLFAAIVFYGTSAKAAAA